MIPCKHQLSLCKLNNCKECKWKGDEQHCPKYLHENELENTPTFKQMIEIYDKHSDSCLSSKRSVISSVTKDIRDVGLTLNSRASEMTRPKFRLLIDMLKSDKRKSGRLRDSTVESHLCAFRSITSKWLEEKYDENGLDMPAFPIPAFRVERNQVQYMTDRQVRQFRIQMEKWLASGCQSEVNAFIYSWFYLFTGMRAGDICHKKWNVLKKTNVGVMVDFLPHKTRKTKRRVSFRLENEVYVMIEPLIRSDNEYIIPRMTQKTPHKLVSENGKGFFRSHHRSLRRRVNKALSDIGVGNEYRGQKRGHALRKYFETKNAIRYGEVIAAQMSGHTHRTAQKSYLSTEYNKVA